MNILPCVGMFVATYYFAAIVQTVLHRFFGHHDRIRKVYETHAKGHHGKYPPHRLITEEWEDSEQHVMWYYAIPFVPAAVVVGWIFGPWLLLSHLAAMSFAIGWHLYLHQQYHLRGSAWRRFGWFRRKRELHFIHHCEVHKNYAIVEYWIDALLGTRKEPAARRPQSCATQAAALPLHGPRRCVGCTARTCSVTVGSKRTGRELG